jgi:hypothetical protein
MLLCYVMCLGQFVNVSVLLRNCSYALVYDRARKILHVGYFRSLPMPMQAKPSRDSCR